MLVVGHIMIIWILMRVWNTEPQVTSAA